LYDGDGYLAYEGSGWVQFLNSNGEITNIGRYSSNHDVRPVVVMSANFVPEITTENEPGSGTTTESTTGQEITFEEENFYIIGGDTVGTEITDSTSKIILLAKYCIVADKASDDYLKQSSTA